MTLTLALTRALIPQPKPSTLTLNRYLEQILITAGDGVNDCKQFMKMGEDGRWSYNAAEVVDYLVSEWEAN